MTPQISIIIPCFNIDKHLSNCIESVISQTYESFELLLINDGSIDDTGKICDAYAKKETRLRVFHIENGGASAARNLGIEQAVGTLFLFIDGDDYIKEDYVSQLLKNYNNSNWPICGMVNVRDGIPTNNTNFQELLQIHDNKRIEKNNFMDLLSYYSFSSPCARIYSASIIHKNKIRFDENVSYQEDLLFNLEYAKYVDSAYLVDYFGYCYVEHKNSSTGRYHKNFKQRERLLMELLIYSNSLNDKRVLQEFIFQTAMREISNIMHKKSLKNENDRVEELNEIFNSDSYLFFRPYIIKSKVNFVLKGLLFFKKATLLYYYFKILK